MGSWARAWERGYKKPCHEFNSHVPTHSWWMWYMVLCMMWRVFTVSSTGRPLWRPGTGPYAARCRRYTCRCVLPDLGSCRICTYSSLEIQIFHRDCKMKFGSGLGVSLCYTWSQQHSQKVHGGKYISSLPVLTAAVYAQPTKHYTY